MSDNVTELTKILRFAQQLFKRDLELAEIQLLVDLAQSELGPMFEGQGVEKAALAQQRDATSNTIAQQMALISQGMAPPGVVPQGPPTVPMPQPGPPPIKRELHEVMEALGIVIDQSVGIEIAKVIERAEPQFQKEVAALSEAAAISAERAIEGILKRLNEDVEKMLHQPGHK